MCVYVCTCIVDVFFHRNAVLGSTFKVDTQNIPIFSIHLEEGFKRPGGLE